MSNLTTLPEIGPKVAGWLEAIGITDADQLRDRRTRPRSNVCSYSLISPLVRGCERWLVDLLYTTLVLWVRR